MKPETEVGRWFEKALRGSEKPGHKYTGREPQAGGYKYKYDTGIKESKQTRFNTGFRQGILDAKENRPTPQTGIQGQSMIDWVTKHPDKVYVAGYKAGQHAHRYGDVTASERAGNESSAMSAAWVEYQEQS